MRPWKRSAGHECLICGERQTVAGGAYYTAEDSPWCAKCSPLPQRRYLPVLLVVGGSLVVAAGFFCFAL